MLDLIGHLCFYGSLATPILVFGVTVYTQRQYEWRRRIAAAALFAAASGVALFWIGSAIALRDGLGPGMIASEGNVAVQRSLPGIAMGLAVGALIATTGAAILRAGTTKHRA